MRTTFCFVFLRTCTLHHPQECTASPALSQGAVAQVAILEKEKALLASAEARASEEASGLSQKMHQAQALLEATRTRLDAQAEAAGEEQRRLLDEVQRLQVGTRRLTTKALQTSAAHQGWQIACHSLVI